MCLSSLANGFKVASEEIKMEASARLRLRSFGLDVGQEIRVIRQCHGHSPMMLRSGGAYLMLRKRDADKILVRHL